MRNWRVAEGMLWDELPKDKSLDDRVPNHSPRWRRNEAQVSPKSTNVQQ